MNVGATIGRPCKGCDFAGSFDKKQYFLPGDQWSPLHSQKQLLSNPSIVKYIVLSVTKYYNEIWRLLQKKRPLALQMGTPRVG